MQIVKYRSEIRLRLISFFFNITQFKHHVLPLDLYLKTYDKKMTYRPKKIICLSVVHFVFPLFQHFFLSIFCSVFLSFCLSVSLSHCLSVSLSLCLSVSLSLCLSVSLSLCLSVSLSLVSLLSVSLFLCLFVIGTTDQSSIMELVGVIVIVEKGQQLLRQKASNEKSKE